MAPKSLPDDWFVAQASVDRTPSHGGQWTRIYARTAASIPDASVATGVGEEPDIGVPEPRDRVDLGATRGVMGRRKGWYVVTWQPAPDIPVYVAARGMTRDQVLDLARAARFREADGSLRLAPNVLPAGFELQASAPIGPLGPTPRREVVALVDGTGAHRVTLDAFSGGAAVREVARFWALDGGAPLGGGRTRSRLLGDTVVLARGGADARGLEAILDGVGVVDDGEWRALRARVLDLPLTAFLTPSLQPGAGQPVMLGGVVDGQRWGVSITAGPGPVGGSYASFSHMVLDPDGMLAGGANGGAIDLSAPMRSLGGGTFGGGRGAGAVGVGVVPARTETLRVEVPGQQPATATLGPVGPDPSHRWYAVYLPGVTTPTTIVALDASGTEIARGTA